MRHNLIRLAAAGGLLALAACGGSSSTGPNNPAGNAGLSADIDGQAWTASAVQVAVSNGIVAIGAADQSGTAIGMAFQDMGTGTYDIAQASPINFTYTSGGQTWAASAIQGTGSLQITTLTANHIVGTFTFSAPGFTGTPVPATTKAVTNGKIDVTF
jgi:hypothetical protein